METRNESPPEIKSKSESKLSPVRLPTPPAPLPRRQYRGLYVYTWCGRFDDAVFGRKYEGRNMKGTVDES